jgi:glycosyltransferase involved in cell wall biosynthesis
MLRRLDLTIVIPAFNAEASIAAALDSTQPLLMEGAQAIVIDDGSTDSTSRVVKEWSSRWPQVSLVRQENQGLSASRNLGTSLCQTAWLTFLDADDQLVACGITAALHAASTSGSRIGKSRIKFRQVQCQTVAPNEGSSLFAGELSDSSSIRSTSDWLLRGWGGLLGCVFRQDLISQLDPPFATVPFGEDLVFMYEIALRERVYADVKVTGYRYTTGASGQMTAPSSPLRLDINRAFATCEVAAVEASSSNRALLWALIQRYRWSRARHVSLEYRRAYRQSVNDFAKGLRTRLNLRRASIVVFLIRHAGSALPRRR